MIRKILVPLDRSHFAEQALIEASVVARRSNAAVRLLLVHQPVPYAGFEDIPWYRGEAAIENEYLDTMLQELSSSKIPAGYAVIRGNPAKVICTEAVKSGCDLIIMTTHGRSGLNRAWMGSVADAVIRHSSVPILLIRPTDHGQPQAKPAAQIRRMLITLDGSPLARSILPAATDFAKCMGAAVTLLTVVQPVPWIPPVTNLPFAFTPAPYDQDVTRQLVAAAETDLANEKARLMKSIDHVDTSVVVAGSVAHAIRDCVDSRRIDLVAMSTHGRGASRYLLGSVADKIVRSSHTPVLVYHPEAKVLASDHDDEQAEEEAGVIGAI